MGNVVPKAAASILVVRDGFKGLEVLMMERHAKTKFAPGALVFPGGKVHASDFSTPLNQRARGTRHLTRIDQAHRLAGIRELFEEAGILMASRSSRRRPLNERERRKLWTKYRAGLENERITLQKLAAAEGLYFNLGDMQPFAHWITPVGMPRRYDTRFYLAAAPKVQKMERTAGGEAVQLFWTRPQTLIEAWEHDDIRLMFPTRLNLLKLAMSDSVSDAFRHARTHPIVTVLPQVIREDGGRSAILPAHAGYGVTRITARDVRAEGVVAMKMQGSD